MDESLQKQVEELRKIVAEQAEANAKLQSIIEELSAQIRLYRAKLFGPSSEKRPIAPEDPGAQLTLFEEYPSSLAHVDLAAGLL